MRLTFAERIGSLRFRRYQHERYGIVTLPSGQMQRPRARQ
jgi:hypothetical protein